MQNPSRLYARRAGGRGDDPRHPGGDRGAARCWARRNTATDNGVRQSLSVIRDAIDSFRRRTQRRIAGRRRPGTDVQEPTLPTYLRGTNFPTCTGRRSEEQSAFAWWPAADRSRRASAAQAATHSWVYKYETGDFHINSDDLSSDGVTTYDEF